MNQQQTTEDYWPYDPLGFDGLERIAIGGTIQAGDEVSWLSRIFYRLGWKKWARRL